MEKKAGIQAFEKFKHINTINSLSGGDVTKWDDILNTPYDRVLTKLLPLTGYIDPANDNSVNPIVNAHYENNDVILDLLFNKKTGVTRAIATPKAKRTDVRIHEKTTIQNDIHTTEAMRSNLKTKIETKTDSTGKHITDHSDPTVTINGLRKVVIWFLVIIAIAGAAIYLVKKFSIAGLISGWIKKAI